MRKLNVLDSFRNKSELYIPILDGKTYLYWFETDPTNERLVYHEMYDLWKKQYDYLKSAIAVNGYTYAIGAKTIFDTVAYDVNGNSISYFDIFQGSKINYIEGNMLYAQQLATNGEFETTTTGWTATTIGTPSVSNGIVSFIATAQFGALSQDILLTDGDIFYLASKIKSDISGSTDVQLQLYLKASPYDQIIVPYLTTDNSWQFLSGIGEVLSTGIHTIRIIDRRASGWTQIQSDYIRLYSITKLKSDKQYSTLYQTTFDLMTNAQIKEQMDLWNIDGTLPQTGIISVDAGQWFDAVGKNLFNLENVTNGYYITSAGVIFPDPTTFYSEYIRVKNNTTYIVSQVNTVITNGYIRVAYYDINKTFISRDVTVASATSISFTTPNDCFYVILACAIANISTIQLELGSIPTTWKKFINGKFRFDSDEKLYRVPNGTKDSIEPIGDKVCFVQRVSAHIIQSADISLFSTAGTNNDYALLTVPSGMIPRTSIENSGALRTTFSNPAWAAYSDTTNLIGKHCYGTGSYSADKVVFVFAKGAYANIDEVRAALLGKVIYYQLATPVENEVSDSGHLLGIPDMTIMQNENSLATIISLNKYDNTINTKVFYGFDSYFDSGWFASEPEQAVVDAWEAEFETISLVVRVPEIVKCIEPIGLGNRFKLLAVDDTVYGHEFDFEDISFKMYFGVNYDAYQGYHILMNMLKSNKAIIEYDWGVGSRYGDVRLLSAPKTEKDTTLLIISKFTFKLLNPFYELIEVDTAEEMTNESNLDSPVKMDLAVTSTTVSIKLLDDALATEQEISFDFTGVSTPFTLTIDPETKKILIDGITDAYDYADHTKDSFIYLPGDSETYTLSITGATVNEITYKKWVIA